MCAGSRRWINGNEGWVGPTAWKMGQLTYNMGLEWRKVCILAQAPPFQVRVFTVWRRTHLLLYIVQYCIDIVYFSPLQVKNKPRYGDMNVHFFLGQLERLQTLTTFDSAPINFDRQLYFTVGITVFCILLKLHQQWEEQKFWELFHMLCVLEACMFFLRHKSDVR